MKFYTVYNKSGAAKEDCILVQTGFSWRSFFFGIIWATYKKLWDLVLLQILLLAITSALTKFCPASAIQISTIAIAIQFFIAFYATSCFLKAKLIRDGYEELDLIASNSEEEAFLRFLSGSKRS
jgi:hypothetical protein